jgi:nucleotide-binding universal stress UspA family protein
MKSIKKILVPTDFSPNAANALDFALGIARGNGLEIHLVHSYSVPYTGSNVMIDISDVLREKAEEDMRLLIEEIRHNKKNDDCIITWSCEYGPASEIIASKAAPVNFDLVVMGTKGSDSVASKLLGSVTYNTIRKIKIPIIVVPEKSVNGEIKKIIFATDLHINGSINKVDYLRDFAIDLGSTIDVLYVNRNANEKPDIQMAIDSMRLENKLKEVYHKFEVVENENIEEGIIDFISTNLYDMLVVIPKHHGFLESLFHKSMTRSLTMHAHLPLLVLR